MELVRSCKFVTISRFFQYISKFVPNVPLHIERFHATTMHDTFLNVEAWSINLEVHNVENILLKSYKTYISCLDTLLLANTLIFSFVVIDACFHGLI